MTNPYMTNPGMAGSKDARFAAAVFPSLHTARSRSDCVAHRSCTLRND